jgi:hypothetical protein
MSEELNVLSPVGDVVELSDGTRVRLLDLKARQFFKLLKILTHGPALQLMANSGGNSLLSGSPEEILGRLVGFIGISIPDAFDETVNFLYDMVEPADLGNTKQSKVEDQAKREHLAQVMLNPELEDLVDLIEAIVKRESADLAALGKKVAKLLNLAEKTGQLDTTPASPAPNTSVASPEPSTSSAQSTVGLTSVS